MGSYLGMPGFNTVQRPGAFSISNDERDQGLILANWDDFFIQRRVSTFAAIRQTAEKAASWSDAVHQLSQVKLSADSYFIIAGVKAGEGAVVTRDRNDVYKTFRMGEYPGSDWYLLETNYDIN